MNFNLENFIQRLGEFHSLGACAYEILLRLWFFTSDNRCMQLRRHDLLATVVKSTTMTTSFSITWLVQRVIDEMSNATRMRIMRRWGEHCNSLHGNVSLTQTLQCSLCFFSPPDPFSHEISLFCRTYHMAWTDTGLKMCCRPQTLTLKPLWSKKAWDEIAITCNRSEA